MTCRGFLLVPVRDRQTDRQTDTAVSSPLLFIECRAALPRQTRVLQKQTRRNPPTMGGTVIIVIISQHLAVMMRE